ncbi:ATP-binding protein [Segetibacter sp.]|jgi:two-component system NtrC family sensor kinase|uniref:sensor histidine kinase n=1 Tax=Segetibacter sp. TaxID=2231182 RepID=UPI00262DD491|nr:ATP-binding protein [Segetibacter sp.]MCW3079066.1 histidine kinase [Segetibacter sp.]
MYLIAIDLEYRVIIGISGMVILFASFIISFVISQRKKLQYHKDLHVLHDEQQRMLTEQNELLEKGVQQRTAELSKQKEELEKTISHLKLTQAQLVQAEKMASLGQLTAGIAHEIQNPLNFVNNFSEVSTELLDEMEEALKKDHKEEAITIATDLKDNLRKITHHGKRAEGIVKGMLRHTQTSAGKKELIRINALASEYLKITHYGVSLKDKTFTAVIETDFDESIGKIEVVPQDIGSVLLNLFNNAFYAVNEKKRQLNGSFQPTVTLTTRLNKSPATGEGETVAIIVRDNGFGISSKVVNKIFQPFFTTKPAGQGTGLGLSLSYDIIKAHGGELNVETKEGEYSSFEIILPI